MKALMAKRTPVHAGRVAGGATGSRRSVPGSDPCHTVGFKSLARGRQQAMSQPSARLQRGLVSPPVAPGVLQAVASDGANPTGATLDYGANLDKKGGCTFRVWAPYPEAAYVVVYGEGQEERKVPLVREEGRHGTWSAFVSNVAAGNGYHFVFVLPGGVELTRRDPYARQSDYDSDSCVVVDPDAFKWSPWTSPEFDELILYQLHVGSFSDSGDFKGLEEKLDYLAGMGFTALQLLPVNEYCGSWGYNPRMLLNVHGPYGTPEQLKILVDEAHKRGLAIIFDSAIHHGASRMNSLWEYDGWTQDNNGGIYHEKGADTPYGRQFAFWKQEVWDMLEASCRMWFTEYNADGLRLDSIHNVPFDKLSGVVWGIKSLGENKYTIAEITPEDPKAIRSGNFSSEWIHSSFYDVRRFQRGHRSMRLLKSIISTHPGFESPHECVKYFTGSHDQIGCRKNGGFDHEIDGNHRYPAGHFGGRGDWDARACTRMWYALCAFSAGAPMMFMGTEMCRDDWWHTDEHRMQWCDMAEDEISQQTMAAIGGANHTRNASKALRAGGVNFVHEDGENGILAFWREWGEEAVLVVANTGGENFMEGSYGVSTGGRGGQYEQVYNSQAAEYGGWAESATEGVVTESDGRLHISVPKLSVLVFRGASSPPASQAPTAAPVA